MDILGTASTFISNLLQKGGGRFSGQVGYMGDFDTDNFIQANLSGGKGGGGKTILQGLGQLIGGHKPAENAVVADKIDSDLTFTPSAMDSQAATPDLRTPGGNLTFLEDVLKGLGQ